MGNVLSAPESLIQWYRDGSVRKGRDLLQSLLTHPDMESAWRVLHSHQKTAHYATQLFKEIVFIEQESRRPVVTRRSEDREQYLQVARQAQKLAATIANGPLDKLAYEYFPPDAMITNGVADWGQLNELARGLKAHALLREWPPLITLLGKVAEQANYLADEAMREPRIVERASLQKTNDRRLYFVRALATYINEEFSAPLFGVVASISNAILGETLSESDISGFVNRAKAI